MVKSILHKEAYTILLDFWIFFPPLPYAKARQKVHFKNNAKTDLWQIQAGRLFEDFLP